MVLAVEVKGMTSLIAGGIGVQPSGGLASRLRGEPQRAASERGPDERRAERLGCPQRRVKLV
jgi:hypothetical protein